MKFTTTSPVFRSVSITFLTVLTTGLLSFGQQGKATLPDEDMQAQTVKTLFNHILTNGKCYTDLEYLCKRIGGRLSGSPQAAAAVEWGKQTLELTKADTTFLQPVMVPHWLRTSPEKARIISKHIGWQEVNICALGNSVGTGPLGITAPVLMIDSLEALNKLDKKAVEGKIVYLNRAFDQRMIDPFDTYSACVGGRYSGAPKAAKLGAVAYVLRSLASNTDEHPHTGGMAYEEGVAKIPAAALATRDADLLSALLTKDSGLTLYLNFSCENRADRPSFNVIGEIKGAKFPNEVIVVGGHLDSWDNGEGAHDDGAGCVQSIEVIRALKSLGIQPARTIRCVLFMNEENGAKGAQEYARWAGKNGEKCVAAIESDRGGFSPRGFTLETASDTVTAKYVQILQKYRPILEQYGLYQFEKGFSGVDVKYLKDNGAACLGLIPDPQRYFNYHHTPNDTFDKINERELKLGAASMAALAYLISENGW
ncbi:peptidase M28 family protein [Sphingobacteriales bacterium UPWRP_1]|nr:hypothetical protein BVG80_04260 [Sphingobacteriales bacterium TSM_CSM]PSJ73486.1 peptidase M28 family protein [Sphingobacteriales bacterium UPWRP_1]